MLGNYTQEANDYLDNLVESEAFDIWADLDTLGTMTSSEQWKRKLESIAQEYRMSSRFALMRILHNRVLSAYQTGNSRQTDVYADEDCFRIRVQQQLLSFGDISVEHAQALTPEEHRNYIRLLLEIAGPSPEEDPDLHERVILRAWHDESSANAVMLSMQELGAAKEPQKLQKIISGIEKENKRRYAAQITREEALQLGHILRFTFHEMQWYLMRVFDCEDGLRMNHSVDLIEAYGFLTGASCLHVAKLRRQYLEQSASIEKRDDLDRSRNWTQRTGSELLENLENWKLHPEEMDVKFLEWMKGHASGLDIPSRTARRIYRNLAVYAYQCAIGKALIPEEDEALGRFLQICDYEEDSVDVRFYLYENGTISRKKCEAIAKCLYRENKERSNSEIKDNTQAWSVITTRSDGALSASYGAVNSSRTRIQSLIMGDEEVEKGDILYLIWFLFTMVWADSPADDPDTLYCRIFDLKDAAVPILEKALLPPFYPPHLMEQSMLLSIIYGGKTGTDPAIVYGSLLQSLKETRNRDAGARKHTLEERLEIVRQHRNGLTLKQCAILNGISEKTLSQWQKELMDKGYFE